MQGHCHDQTILLLGRPARDTGLAEAAWCSSVFPDASDRRGRTRSRCIGVWCRPSSFDLALVDLGLPDGSGVDVVEPRCASTQPETARAVVVTIHDDDEHLFPALQAGAFGYILKEQARELIIEQLQRISQGEPPLSPSIARRVMAYFRRPSPSRSQCRQSSAAVPHVSLTDRETEVLLRVAKGYTLPEIGQQLDAVAGTPSPTTSSRSTASST